ncbi:MAG: 1,4-alpha-glucan branching protein [Chitinophagaceae bacterium]|jgi:glycosidase|nr:1,4-alpha-glucan branching protein [Chitinophagaceae bacterium]
MANKFKTVGWATGTNIYEVNVRQYTSEGTFSAFEKHLPRLKGMGVEILWFMPVTPISVLKRQGALGSYYACSSYTSVNPEFGTGNDFRNLINTAHQLGLKVIIDWVANHTGWDHHWTTEHPDWYVQDKHGNFMEKNGWIDVIDLNYQNSNLRQTMINAMQYWIGEFDIDGFRCDMANLVPLDFWEEARRQCDALKPLFWLAETEEDAYLDVFDCNYTWRWMHATEAFVRHENSLQDVKNILTGYNIPNENYAKMFFTSNHDENSWNGTEYEKYGLMAKPLAAFTAIYPGIPLVYSGQELPNMKRLLFFDKDEIEWKENTLPALHNFYKSLLNLRKSNAALHFGARMNEINTYAANGIYMFLLEKGNQKVLALFNFSATHLSNIFVEHELLSGNYRNVFSGIKYAFKNQEQFELMPYDYLIYSAEM